MPSLLALEMMVELEFTSRRLHSEREARPSWLPTGQDLEEVGQRVTNSRILDPSVTPSRANPGPVFSGQSRMRQRLLLAVGDWLIAAGVWLAERSGDGPPAGRPA